MAEKDERKKPADGTAASPPPGKQKKKKILVYAGIGLVAVAGVAAAVFFFFNSAKSGAAKDNTAAAHAKEGGHGAGKEGGHGGKEKAGNPLTFALEPFILNLADIDSNRYLKISVTLELDSPATVSQAEARVPQIRDAMILLMTSLTYGDVHSVAGKLTLQSEIQNRISKIVEPGAVKRVYFTDLVVQ